MTLIPSMRAVLSDLLTDGATVIMQDPITGEQTLLIGTRPLTWAQAEGRRIVREGMRDVLEWLGWPVEPPSGQRIYAMLRGQPTPSAVADVIPLANRTFSTDTYLWRYMKPKPFNWLDPEPEAYVSNDVLTVEAKTFSGRATVQYEDPLPPEVLLTRLYDAIRGLQHEAGEALRSAGRVADVTLGLPAPTISVEMRLKTWPAIPGVTTADLPTGGA